MRSLASVRLLLPLLLVLTVSSVGLKAAAGPVNDGKTDSRPGLLESQLSEMLRAQGFATKLHPLRLQSSIVYAIRGDCRLSVRDARAGTAVETVFARDAASIGPVRYLYRDDSSATAPAFRMRLGRLEAEMLRRIGIERPIPVPVALATSPACGNATFGLQDVRVAA
jgi:hypothetical protein